MTQPVATWSGLSAGRALDLRRRRRDVQLSRLAVDDPFAAVARHQGASAAYLLVDPGDGSSLLLAVRTSEDVHERTRRDFADDCQVARIPAPAALWALRDLPRWLRRRLDSV